MHPLIIHVFYLQLQSAQSKIYYLQLHSTIAVCRVSHFYIAYSIVRALLYALRASKRAYLEL